MKRKSINSIISNPDKDNEYYVLVTREYPMQFRFKKLKMKDTPIDKWDRDLAPSRELLKKYKSLKNWEKYREGFYKEVSKKLIISKINMYKQLAKKMDKELVIICEEEEDKYPHCHTWLILEIVEN